MMENLTMSVYRSLALASAMTLLAACATVPQPLTGNYTPVTVQSAQQGGAGGTRVRWGGEIIKTEPGPQDTCFFLLARPLDSQARPEVSSTNDNQQGRFVACHAGFYDPQIFSPGRELTITGTLHGAITEKVGGYDYAYPRVEADVVYLWPRRQVAPAYGYGYGYYGYCDPFWGPGWGPGPGWGCGWGAPYFYGGTRVIIAHPAPAPHGGGGHHH